MPLYAASDLHANNNFWAMVDENRKRVFKSKLPNDAERILMGDWCSEG